MESKFRVEPQTLLFMFYFSVVGFFPTVSYAQTWYTPDPAINSCVNLKLLNISSPEEAVRQLSIPGKTMATKTIYNSDGSIFEIGVIGSDGEIYRPWTYFPILSDCQQFLALNWTNGVPNW